ncbi:MAG TPA: peptidoglycan-associated lipoprotein Pal [Burkholderiales bacterium]|jgi:peptidoglycan-associated lipoprotein|nr:peptidoglycan-associated lipoprotein Pal [Burkholderiales bacterium]
MKKSVFIILLAGLLAACASKEAKQESQETQPEMGVAKGTTQTFGEQPAAQPVAQAPGMPTDRSVHFDFDKSNIKQEYVLVVQTNAEYMAGNASARVTVQGNCDERGSREYNLGLGQRRADSVKQALIAAGASGSNIQTVSFGKEKPVCTEHNEQCWWRNRRADIVYQGE